MVSRIKYTRSPKNLIVDGSCYIVQTQRKNFHELRKVKNRIVGIDSMY